MCAAATKITADLESAMPGYASRPPAAPAPPPLPIPIVVDDAEAALMAKARALLADYEPDRAASRKQTKPSDWDPSRSSLLAKQRASTAKKEHRSRQA
jgi:hypothetical protein